MVGIPWSCDALDSSRTKIFPVSLDFPPGLRIFLETTPHKFSFPYTAMRRAFPPVVFFLGLVFVSSSSAQVKIKERVTITPGPHSLPTLSVGERGVVSNLKIIPSDEITDFGCSVLLKESISFGERIKLVITARELNGGDLPWTFFEEDTVIVSIEENASVGRLEGIEGMFVGRVIESRGGGDTVLVAGEESDCVEVRFVADEISPSGSVTVRIRATFRGLTAEALVTVTGDGLITTVKVSVDPAEVRPTGTGGNNTTTVKVVATSGGAPEEGVSIVLTREAIEGSGGHNHIGDRPAGLFLNEAGDSVITITKETGVNGQFSVVYESSKFGGEEKIIATAAATPSVSDTDKLLVKVRSLDTLTASAIYELVGAPDNHTGTNDPCRTAESLKSLHNQNHFGTGALISVVQNIAASFDSLHPGIRLRINDMSLKSGGLFDIDNKWRTPHREHKLGKNADIGFEGIDTTNSCVSINRRDLARLIRNYTQLDPLSEGNHYHVYTR